MLTMFLPIIAILIMGFIIIALDRYSRKKRIEIPILILLIVSVGAAIYVIGSLIIDAHMDKKVVSRESIGIAQTAQFFPSAIRNASTTQITTDKGTFLVDGSFQLIKGDQLFIEKRASGKSYLCDGKTGDCYMMDR